MKTYNNVDEYINSQSKTVREKLIIIRDIIKKSAPDAEEVISYGMPAFKYNGILIWYAGFKNHYSIFPKTDAVVEFAEELKNYETRKGTIKFPLDKPVPVNLIRKIINFRVQMNIKTKLIKNNKKRK